MKFAAKTDTGLQREINQDNFLVQALPGNACFAIVCDGMGGAANGEIASANGVEAIRKKISENYYEEMTELSIKVLLTSAVEEANKTIYYKACQSSEYQGMGTTVVAAIAKDDFVYIVHAGDSRAYLVDKDNGKIVQLTRDHSVVQRMVENGEISPNEAADHPKKNLITRALGVEPDIRADFCQESFTDGNILLLCTDGLTNFVDERAILVLCNNNNLDFTVEQLINSANLNGGGDNITAVAILKCDNSEEVNG